jgi:uncharacterized DUF497 family protein
MWIFSNHAKIRIEERKYSFEEILKILNEEVSSIILQSPREDTVDLYFGEINSKYLMIVIDRVTHVVITIRPMRKKEKQNYIQEMKNG